MGKGTSESDLLQKLASAMIHHDVIVPIVLNGELGPWSQGCQRYGPVVSWRCVYRHESQAPFDLTDRLIPNPVSVPGSKI